MGDVAAEFWIDVGGTFTDCFCRFPDGSLRRHKLLSTGVTKGACGHASKGNTIVDPARAADPPGFWQGYRIRLLGAGGEIVDEQTVESFGPGGRLEFERSWNPVPKAGQGYELSSGEEAPIVAIRYLLGRKLREPLPPVSVRLGTTRGTNALIERRGARTALVTTRGFADILHIGYQNRPRLFDLTIRKPEPLFAAVVEIDERMSAVGEVMSAPAADHIRRQLAALAGQQIDSLAICLLNAYRNGTHEEQVAAAARELGFREISLSSRVSPLVKIVARGDTTVVDAYLNPVLRQYVERLRAALGTSELRLMTSAGGLVRAEEFIGKDSILSGPAGGVVGFSRVAESAGFRRAIGFDMGGTSTDVARYDGRWEFEYETEKAGVRVVAPMMAIETVAAGGGSICGFDGVKLFVGPHSAGADPGPACYGRGGPLAVTDVNFYLGRIPADRFPFPLDRPAVERRLAELIERIEAGAGKRYAPHELCDGFLQVANSSMVRAIAAVSIAKGADPRDYALVAFGGAAGQHACAVARELGIRHILNHPDAGILSAYGIGMAEVSRHRVAGVYRPLAPASPGELEPIFAGLEAEARADVVREGITPDRIRAVRSVQLRYRGLDASLSIPAAGNDWARSYADAHRRLYGFAQPERPIEIVAVRVEVAGSMAELPAEHAKPTAHAAAPDRTAPVYFAGKICEAPVYDRANLAPGANLAGPAVIYESLATTVLEPGWHAEVLAGGVLLATDDSAPARKPISADADPVMLEVFNHQFAAIAEQMGITLRNTASSVNVKERLDFSCALFTSAGDLVVNAPHIPVHLGAMSETVRRVKADNPDLAPGDVIVTNDPYRGGSHLPDVTVVTPVHDPDSGRLLFFTASRAHHAEIGGSRPGSLPPFSRTLAEEGVLIRNFKLVAAGQSRFDKLGELLTQAPLPTRNLADNLADLTAQVAANEQGARDLARLVERYSLPVVLAYMQHIQDAAERKMRASLGRLKPGRYAFTDHLDEGSPISVAIEISGDSATIDFTGTGPVLETNLNANRAIVTAAVIYVLRTLIGEDIPLNQGILAPVKIVLPTCLLNPAEGPTPETSPAVVGGNVETSQRVVDVLLGALGLAAASQGTMNNVVFGDAHFGYYETICGGSGATAGGPGADAVHTHMTNTRLTDPEVLEQRYPIRVREFSIRRGSGGVGRNPGGAGIVRRLEFLAPVEVSILSQRRGPYPPYGLNGGAAGQFGRNLLQRSGTASEELLTHRVQFAAGPGDVLSIETPGGGGWGEP